MIIVELMSRDSKWVLTPLNYPLSSSENLIKAQKQKTVDSAKYIYTDLAFERQIQSTPKNFYKVLFD